MGLFSARQPRKFRRVSIYTDERKERLQKLVEQVEREKGDVQPVDEAYDTSIGRIAIVTAGEGDTTYAVGDSQCAISKAYETAAHITCCGDATGHLQVADGGGTHVAERGSTCSPTKADVQCMPATVESALELMVFNAHHLRYADVGGELHYLALIRVTSTHIVSEGVPVGCRADDEVGINNIVTVESVDDGEIDQYKIVTTIRSNALIGLISIESPMGKALLGHKVGDRVTVKVNENVSYDVIINDIDKTADDADDQISQY